MGLAVLAIYIPIFLVVSAISIGISTFILRVTNKSEVLVRNKHFKFFIGAVTALLLSTAYAWWFSKTDSGLDAIVGAIAISLLGPPIIGLITFAFTRIFFGYKHPSFFWVASGALVSTLIMPLLGILIYRTLDSMYSSFLFRPMFINLCAPAKVEIFEIVDPPKGLAVIPLRIKPRRHAQSDPVSLLLPEKTPLQFVEKVDTASNGGEKYIRVSRKINLNNQIRNRRYEKLFSSVPVTFLSAEYNVKFLEIETSKMLGYIGETNGQRIEIERVSDGKIIAVAEGYWNYQQHSECPNGFADSKFVTNFVSNALNIPNLTDK